MRLCRIVGASTVSLQTAPVALVFDAILMDLTNYVVHTLNHGSELWAISFRSRVGRSSDVAQNRREITATSKIAEDLADRSGQRILDVLAIFKAMETHIVLDHMLLWFPLDDQFHTRHRFANWRFKVLSRVERSTVLYCLYASYRTRVINTTVIHQCS